MKTAIPDGGMLQKYKTGILKDVSMAEAGKYASLKEYAFFDQVGVHRHRTRRFHKVLNFCVDDHARSRF